MQINIVYWSGTGNTEAMAKFIQEGAESAGASVIVKEDSQADSSVLDADVLALGCPSMGEEELEETEFEPFVASIEGAVEGKKLALFGSYGWGDGQWMRDWSERMEKAGAELIVESLIVNEAPEGDECKSFGSAIAS
ncbi:MAG: flavodoxin [Syntrophomonadaceae bacterium]|jgi:flavodoxin short chain|nr:flavodoxin [Syntrophomonadaceae bacterium]